MQTKTAHRDGTCRYCQMLVSGDGSDELYPVAESLCTLARAQETMVCQPAVTIETVGWGINGDNSSSSIQRILWIHAECAITVFNQLNLPINPPVCRHWYRSRGQNCPFGDECFFLHPPEQQQEEEEEETQTSPLLLSHRRTWGGRRRKLFKPTSSIFRSWVLQKFGHQLWLGTGLGDNEDHDVDSDDHDSEKPETDKSTLQQHSRRRRQYVLDVAGGNGRLAFELENLSGVPTAVIDPRPLTLRKAYNKWKSGFYDRAATSPKLNRFLTHYDRNVEPQYPLHLRIFFDDALTERVVKYQTQLLQQQQQQRLYEAGIDYVGDDTEEEMIQTPAIDDWWKDCLDTARRRAWTPKGLENDAISSDNDSTTGKEEKKNENDVKENGNGQTGTAKMDDDDTWLSRIPLDVRDASTALSVLADCSMVIGMHPDQATEAAVDFALQMNKPFAVVPCCVFSTHFPRRRLRDGVTKVKTTSQLVQYLAEKDDRIRVETLPFEGMNQVVFLTPDQINK
jgi:Zinc finger C-x8-C-x5-C-x3-H type (and similar)